MIWRLCIFFLLTVVAIMATNAYSEDIMDILKDGYEITIIAPGNTARLCPRPMCSMNEYITRIPENTVLKVAYSARLDNGAPNPGVWCYVIYKGKGGWISIYDTDQ